MKLSVIIPCHKDPYLQKTIDSLLENATGEIEVIAVLDGYWADPPLREDPRVRIVHLGEKTGMRGAINAGVAVARGEYLMRTDAHAIFGKGYDEILAKDCPPNCIVTPRRYFLDPIKWEVMDIPPVDYSKLVIQDIDDETRKWAGQDWRSRTKERKDIPIDETMAMQGSCWFMPHKWWDDVIGELQSEGYGTHYGDSHEMVFKTWKAGGKLLVNKNTWHAHKERSFPRSHNYGRAEAAPGWNYSVDLWKDYYLKEIKPKWGI